MGEFRVEVREDLMPITAGNFIDLVEKEFYDGVIFHRVVRGFVNQGGDPSGTGSGGPGYTIMDEYHPNMNHDSTGVMGMAKTSAPNSAGSQFYFIIGAQKHLDRNYAVFGSCIRNLDVIKEINKVRVNVNDRPLENVVMDSVRIVQGTSSLDESEDEVLSEVFPNPFSTGVQINYKVKTAGDVDVAIYNLQGTLIRTLKSGQSPSGIFNLNWDGSGVDGSYVPSGEYYLTFTTPSGVSSQKLIKIE
jgi:peptidyl-prolyl cis-trans isomerase A (cyclophilin A)